MGQMAGNWSHAVKPLEAAINYQCFTQLSHLLVWELFRNKALEKVGQWGKKSTEKEKYGEKK